MIKLLVGLSLLSSGLTCLAASTSAISTCSAGTLASYEASYAPPSLGCSIGILDYSNFSYVAFSNAPATSSIQITNLGTGLGFTQVGGAPFVANAGQIVKFGIYYNIYIDPAPVIVGADDSIDPSGNVSITEYFCNDSVLYPKTTSCFPPSSTAYQLTVTTTSPTASIIFPVSAKTYETVGIIFTLDGTDGPAVFDGLNTDTVVTPEPASICLVGLFLLGSSYKLRKYVAARHIAGLHHLRDSNS